MKTKSKNKNKYRAIGTTILILLLFGSVILGVSAAAVNTGNLDKIGDKASPGITTFTVPPQSGKILLLDDGGSPEQGHEGKGALDAFGYTYTYVSPAEFAAANLNDYNIIFVAWLPTQAEIDALNARKTDITNWINNGGGIIVNAQWKDGVYGVTNPYSFLPVTYGTTDNPSPFSDGVTISNTTHPLVSGLTDALLSGWGSSVHGEISVAPPETSIVSKSTTTNYPEITGMCYGAGKIVVAATDPEFHIMHGPGDGPWILLSNELKWASERCLPKKVKYGFWMPFNGLDASSYEMDWNTLTHVAYFAWDANGDGKISKINRTMLKEYNDIRDNYAHPNGVKVIITVRPNNFDLNKLDGILSDPNIRESFANNLLATVQDNKADGVNLDFEFIHTTNNITRTPNSPLFEDLMKRIHNKLKSANPEYHISFDVAGYTETPYLNGNLANYSDAVFLMGYDYTYQGSKNTGAVSPYNEVVSSIQNLLKYYPKEQIILGVPFYGYKWQTESDQKGSSIKKFVGPITMTKAVIEAPQNGGRKWDTLSQTPWYVYQVKNKWYQTWYDDEESLGLKFDYVNSENLGGIGFWSLGQEDEGIWDVIMKKFI